jgi:two-component system LytT family sensor kinase
VFVPDLLSLTPLPFALARRNANIARVNQNETLSRQSIDRSDTPRAILAPLVLCIVGLTLLFTVQDAMRRASSGIPMNWSRSLQVNVLDWGTWGALALLIALIGRRHRLDRGGNRSVRVIVWFSLGVGSCIAQSLITGVAMRQLGLAATPFPLRAPPPLRAYLMNWTVSTFGFNAIIFLMIVGAFHAALYYRDLRTRQLREIDLAARLARSELNVLRMQLQPHFFFNALHTVSSLMLSDVPTAHRVITALGDLLRSSIDHTADQEISLGQELTFVARYVEIQHARFRNRLDVHIDVPDSFLDALVPSLVLQPLVENAIRHGIEPFTRGGAIWIAASRMNDDLVLSVRDDGSANVAGDRPPSNVTVGPGVGLSNIEARLAQLYGTAHRFRAGRSADGCFEVVLTLPFHTTAGLFPAASIAS